MTADHEGLELPWSPQAEQSVLGAVLLDNRALDRCAERRLEAAHFYDHRHRAVWTVAAELVAKGLPADVITVFERLRDTGRAEKFGDEGALAYINAVAAGVSSAANVTRYADIVLDKHRRRELLTATDQARELARSPDDTDTVLDRVASLFVGIKRSTAGRGPRRLGEVMTARMEHWQAMGTGDAQPGIPTGLESLDKVLGGGLKAGKVIVLAARPSVGKTSLAGQIGLHVAAQGHPVLMLSQEMTAGDLADRAAANLGGVSMQRLAAGAFEDADWHRLSDAAERAHGLPFYVDDTPALSLLDIRAKAREVQQREGLALLVVDYLQLCASSISADRRHLQIEQISRGMKTLAKELGVCVLLLSQLKRTERGEPELDHLKESGAIEEDADSVVLLHPCGVVGKGYALVLAKIAKNRQGGRPRLALAFYGGTQRWECSDADVSRKSLEAGA